MSIHISNFLDDPVPRVLFKYLRRKHAIKMVTKGEIGIGNLYYYNPERVDEGIADSEEGVQRFTEYVDVLTDNPSWIVDQCIGGLRNANRVLVADCTCNVRRRERNCHVYCTSLALNEKIMRRMEPSYDTAVGIKDPLRFCRAAGRALRGEDPTAEPGQYWYCKYRGRDFGPTDVCRFPLELKEARDAYQEEFRLTWTVPPDHPLPPTTYRVVRDREIAQVCEIVRPRDFSLWR